MNLSATIRMMVRGTPLVLAGLLMSGCQARDGQAPVPPPVPTAPAISAATAAPDKLAGWLGRWQGPEGTYLSIEESGDAYSLEIADLDGPKRYAASRDGDQLRFERNGKTETIRATDGPQTGMKWLQDKSDCLTINSGEGFCRD